MFLLLKTLIKYPFVKPQHTEFECVTTRLKVMPWHLDYNIHVNNAVYLKYFENARWNHSLHTGLLKKYMDNKYGFVLASTEVGFYREIGLFSKLYINTQVVGTDGKYMYFSQDIVDKKGKVYTNAMVKAAVIYKGKLKPATEALAEMGLTDVPALPKHFHTWGDLTKHKREYTSAKK